MSKLDDLRSDPRRHAADLCPIRCNCADCAPFWDWFAEVSAERGVLSLEEYSHRLGIPRSSLLTRERP